jgi:hypothetical protein
MKSKRQKTVLVLRSGKRRVFDRVYALTDEFLCVSFVGPSRARSEFIRAKRVKAVFHPKNLKLVSEVDAEFEDEGDDVEGYA